MNFRFAASVTGWHCLTGQIIAGIHDDLVQPVNAEVLDAVVPSSKLAIVNAGATSP